MAASAETVEAGETVDAVDTVEAVEFPMSQLKNMGPEAHQPVRDPLGNNLKIERGTIPYLEKESGNERDL